MNYSFADSTTFLSNFGDARADEVVKPHKTTLALESELKKHRLVAGWLAYNKKNFKHPKHTSFSQNLSDKWKTFGNIYLSQFCDFF